MQRYDFYPYLQNFWRESLQNVAILTVVYIYIAVNGGRTHYNIYNKRNIPTWYYDTCTHATHEYICPLSASLRIFTPSRGGIAEKCRWLWLAAAAALVHRDDSDACRMRLRKKFLNCGHASKRWLAARAVRPGPLAQRDVEPNAGHEMTALPIATGGMFFFS